jgi:polyhydroxybutyrate depolymerase
MTLVGVTALACSDEANPPSSGTGGSGGTGGVSAAGSGGTSAGTGGGGTNAGGGGSGGTNAGNGGSSAGNTSGGTSAGTGGTSGSAGNGGAAGSGGAAPATPSAGCDKPAGQDLGKWVEQPKISVNNKDRQWWVWLPEGYDPKRAYPVVYTFHGCGGPTNFIPGTGVTQDGCWTYSGAGEDVKFFDATLAKIESDRCVDSSRVFSTGYSSGAWLTNTLACARGDKLRGAGTVSGGVVGDRGTCVGKFARLFVHDATDTTNKFVDNGNEKELGRIRDQNHCTAGDPVPESPEPCARYQGCDAGDPVILCKTTGKGHDRQDDLATTAFWNLFKSL